MLELIDPDIPRTWRKLTLGQLKIWAATLKEDPVRLIGPVVVGIRRLNKEWASLAIDLTQAGRAWPAVV